MRKKRSTRLSADQRVLFASLMSLAGESVNSADSVNHPSHYNSSDARCECGKRIECIEVVRYLSFNVGNAIKYLWRLGLKNDAIEDLKKARWYIDDEIKTRERKNNATSAPAKAKKA